MLRINCFMAVPGENRDQVIAYAIALTEASRAEDGCVAYDIFGSQTELAHLLICETWRDAAALEAHRQSAHYQEYVPKMRELAKMKTEVFDFPAR